MGGSSLSSPRILLFDIESSNLNANFGFMIAFGYKWLGDKKTNVLSITDYPLFKKDPTNDKALVRAAASLLSEADMWVGHYSSRFDIPFVQTRMLDHGFGALPPVAHFDTWRQSRQHLALNSNRLATIAAFLDLGDKTPVRGRAWIRASAGHIPSIRYIKDHCRKDVDILERAYLVLREVSRNHPNVALLGMKREGCPTCGGRRLQRRGFRLTANQKFARIQCMECGAWSSKLVTKKEEVNDSRGT